MAAGTDTLKRTPLHARHVAAGARLVPFAGWEMPVQYEGIRQEHTAVRERAGIFDVSHMGQVETTGPQAEAFLQRLLSNDVSKIAERGAQYSVLCNPDGGVRDDLFTYRLGPDRFLTVTNAANHERDLAWFREQARPFDVTIADRIADYVMLAVQGPEARGIVAALTDGELPKRFTTRELTVAQAPGVLVCGTGYTGEDGVELLAAPEHATTLWDAITARDVTPVGLGARDTLRLEACFHLYGNDLSEDRNPIEAGLGWCCKEDTDFVGAEPIRRRGPRARPISSCRSRSPAAGSRARATRSKAAAWSPPGRCRPCSATASGSPISRRRAPSPARHSRSTCAASAGAPKCARSP